MLKMVKEQNRNKSWPLQCFAAVMMTMQSIHNSLGKKAWTWIFPVLVLFEFYSPIINIVLHKNNLILPWEKLLLYLKTKSLKFNPKSIVFANDLWILFLLAALLLCRSKWSNLCAPRSYGFFPSSCYLLSFLFQKPPASFRAPSSIR